MEYIEIRKDLFWIGAKDPDLRIFDIVVETKYGSTYNSYFYRGSDKNVLIDTVKLPFLEKYLQTLEQLIPLSEIDYIIVNHTEPDHAGSIQRILELNPKIIMVGTGTALKFLKEIVNLEFDSIVVKENDTLSLGNKTLQFMVVPNLHWPDTMITHAIEDKILFTCDFFGAHYCPKEILLSNLSQEDRNNHLEAYRHYYECIMAPFNTFVEKAMNRLEHVEFDMICNGHGPILDTDLEVFKKENYSLSRQTKNEIPVLIIPFVSSYGYTKILAEKIAEGVHKAGNIDVRVYDMLETNHDFVVKELEKADGILLGSPTILSDALKPIWDLATSMLPVTHGGKLASAFGSYGWTGEAVPFLIERLKNLRMKVVEGYRVRFKASSEEEAQAIQFGLEFGIQLIELHEKRR